MALLPSYFLQDSASVHLIHHVSCPGSFSEEML